MGGTARKQRPPQQQREPSPPPASSGSESGEDFDDDEAEAMEEDSDHTGGGESGESGGEEEDDEDVPEDQQELEQLSSPPGTGGSGPNSGMRLRSGRKKRRRSRSAAASTNANTDPGAGAASSARKKSAARRPSADVPSDVPSDVPARLYTTASKKRKRQAAAAATKARKTVRIAGYSDGSSSSSSADSDSDDTSGSGSEVEEEPPTKKGRGAAAAAQKGKKKTNGTTETARSSASRSSRGNRGRRSATKRRRRDDEGGPSSGEEDAKDDDGSSSDEEMEDIAAATTTERQTAGRRSQDDAEADAASAISAAASALASAAAFLSPPADRAALAEAAGAGADDDEEQDGDSDDGSTSPLQSVSLQLPPRTVQKSSKKSAAAGTSTAGAGGSERNGSGGGHHLSGREDPVLAAEAEEDNDGGSSTAAESTQDGAQTAAVSSRRSRPGLLRRTSAHLWKFTDTIRPTVRPGVGRVEVPAAERPTRAAAGDGAAAEAAAELGATTTADATTSASQPSQHRGALRQNPVFWLVAWLVLHTVVAMLSGGIVVRPLWSSLPETSQRRLHLYRSLLNGSGGSTDGAKVNTPNDMALGDEGDDNEEPALEPEVVEKVVEEIVYEDEPDDDLYKAALQIRKEAAIAIQRQEDQEAADATADALTSHEAKKMWSELWTAVELRNKEAKSVANQVDAQTQSYEEFAQEGNQAVAARGDRLDAWEEALRKAERAIQKLEADTAGSSDGRKRLTEALDALGAVSVLPIMTSLLDARTVTTPGEDCNGMDYRPVGDAANADAATSASVATGRRQAEEDAEDAPIQMSDLEQAKRDLLQLADATADTIMRDDGILHAVQRWLAQEIKNADLDLTAKRNEGDVDDGVAVRNKEQALAAGKWDVDGLSPQLVKQMIDTRLGLDIADGGMFDFASIRSGATVVRFGPRRTSPSLKDNLPLLNRLLASAKLRFYGHPPEAALNPTYPQNALGQCWAFEAGRGPLQPEDDADNTVGRYATLTINLAEPVQIKSVTMEHAPRDLTPTPETAIRDFRVIGYEDTDADGTPIPLGSFQYEIDGPRMLQDFEVESEHNEALHLMKSITLAIDSNWGADYSCLYRFRVHGDRSVPLPQSSVHASCE